MDKVEELKKEIVSLKIRILRLEEYVSAFPNAEDFISTRDTIEDPIYETAKEIIDNYDEVSASHLQRSLSIGYSRAARILDALTAEGFLSEPNGNLPRKVIKD